MPRSPQTRPRPTAAGPVLDTDLRIDARDCTFVESGERRQAEIHLIAAIWGTGEKPLDTFERSYTVSLAPAAYERPLSEGLVQRMQMKVKRPGAYQIRAAVLDRQANRLGSASDFVEVPDLKRGKLALSGIALTRADGAEEGTRLRYRRGETVNYTVQILNATAGVEVRAALYRGGWQLGTSEPRTVDGRGQADPRRWIAGNTFRLGKQLLAGDYTLQLTVTERAAPARPTNAVQFADFEVVE
jgi:hypothetical protein